MASVDCKPSAIEAIYAIYALRSTLHCARIAFAVGLWRSLVARLNGVQEAPRSNRGSPTKAYLAGKMPQETPPGAAK